ncbi:MAG: DUF3127 domain-containing protein [Candidatus Amulumruptor caecigallinarius]|nr:DUF3127 domain-containing protein [Candidatus Amulumruptor caecigallinarius]
MEIEGVIIMDIPLVEGVSKAGNPWKKKEWVLETPGQYPKKVCFNTFGERCDTLRFEVGKSYVVSVDLESREFNGRWYTDVRAYAMRESGSASPTQNDFARQPANVLGTTATPATEQLVTSSNETDDLPF